MGLILIAMRHSHSVSSHECKDHERPLTDDGVELARATAGTLGDLQLIPEIIVSSSAERAKQTAQLIAAQVIPETPLTVSTELYLAEADVYFPVIQQTAPHDQATVMIVGHNPGIARLIQTLSDRTLSVGPATAAVFDIDAASWTKLHTLSPNGTSLRHLIVDGLIDT